MLESRYMPTVCEHCEETNDVALLHFVGDDYKFREAVVAMCETCRGDYVVTLDVSKIQ